MLIKYLEAIPSTVDYNSYIPSFHSGSRVVTGYCGCLRRGAIRNYLLIIDSLD